MSFAIWMVAVAAEGKTLARPNFSGTWTVAAPTVPADAPKPTRGDQGSGWRSPLTITQEENRFTLEYAFFAPGELQAPLTFSCALDGTETSTTIRMGRGAQEQRWRARWEGASLVITTIHPFVDPGSREALAVEVTRTLTLDTPSSLTVETTRAGVLGGGPTSTRVRYTRP